MAAVSNHALLGDTALDVLAAARAAPKDILARQQARLSSLLYTLAHGSNLYAHHLRAFIADSERIGEPYLERYVVWESSGSSGVPAIFVQDAHCMAINDALESLRRSPFIPSANDWTSKTLASALLLSASLPDTLPAKC